MVIRRIRDVLRLFHTSAEKVRILLTKKRAKRTKRSARPTRNGLRRKRSAGSGGQSLAKGGQPLGNGIARQTGDGVNIEFVHDAFAMRLDGAYAHAQLPGDFLVAHALGDEDEHFAFAG